MPAILLWNDDWNLAGPPRTLGEGSWDLVRDRRSAALADAIVFHIPTLDAASLPDGRRPGQRWVAWSMESEANYPALADPGFMAPFDLTMTYRRDADVWVPYLPAADELLRPPVAKTEAAPAVYIASNPRDRSGRDAYVGELMRHLAVDAYGACRRNRILENDDGRPAKLRTIARYRFTLAFENSVAPDYVTEKFYDALVAGSVPVVLGAPNTRELAPGDPCFVDTADFDDPAALAARLKALADDEDAYASYLAWKRTGLAGAFAALHDVASVDPWVRLARRLTAT
jgi:alpha-1,3-fucosyltransferase 10